MALAYETLRALPRLRNYHEAVQWEANVKPIRGDAENPKPLGKRNQKWRSIAREDNGDIVIKESGRVAVRYRPNGDILVHDVSWWNKASQNEVLGEVLWLRVETYQGAMWAHVNGGKFRLRTDPKQRWDRDIQAWVAPDGHPVENIFRNDERGNLYYVNPPGVIRHLMERKKAKEVRGRYAPFKRTMAALVKIMDKAPSAEAYVEPFGVDKGNIPSGYLSHHSAGMPPAVDTPNFNHTAAAELCSLMLSDDPEDQYCAQLWLLRTGWRADLDGWRERMDRVIIMHHHKEVLRQEEAMHGVMTKDNYAWAVPRSA
jgi:hypothetical protein